VTSSSPSVLRRIVGWFCIIIGGLALIALPLGYQFLQDLGCSMALSWQAREACEAQPIDWAEVSTTIGIPMLFAAALVWLGIWVRRPRS
jgi:hypothetical protein